MEIIISTPEQLENTLIRVLGSFLNKTPDTPITSDRCDIKEAMELTNLSKSKIYKLTSKNKIPFEVYCNRLVFSKQKLKVWIEEQTFTKYDSTQMILNLRNSALNKLMA